MRTDSDPPNQLNEAVQAALFTQHPYGKPIIGWSHEIESLERADALVYYDRFYTPENAVLVVAGDVDAKDVIGLAEKYYGPVPARGEPPKRFRPREPEPRAHRLVTLFDEKVEQPSHQSVFLVPSYKSAAPGEAEALEVLAQLLGGGQTSLLFKSLVMYGKLAVSAGARRVRAVLGRRDGARGAVPAGLRINCAFRHPPTLKRGANKLCAYGADFRGGRIVLSIAALRRHAGWLHLEGRPGGEPVREGGAFAARGWAHLAKTCCY